MEKWFQYIEMILTFLQFNESLKVNVKNSRTNLHKFSYTPKSGQ